MVRKRGLALAAVLLAALLMPAARAEEDFSSVTDQAVASSIAEGVAFIKAQRSGGHWERGGSTPTDKFHGGSSALALLALLYANEDPREPEMSGALDWLAGQPLSGTYAIGLRAHVFALVPGTKYRERLKKDLAWLVAAQRPRGDPDEGAFGYQTVDVGGYDNSNSQFGVLGAWMASEAGLAPPDHFWQLTEEHWLRDQSREGGWGYLRDGPTNSMTAAGLATMFVVLDRSYGRDSGVFDGKATPRCGSYKNSSRVIASINRALSYLSDVFSLENRNGDNAWQFYYLYGVERVGRASGRKYFGDKDWFNLGARFLLEKQQANGSWEGTGTIGDMHQTCFAVMFLCHGRAPLLFNKLAYGDDSGNKLRDVAGLNRYAQNSFERLLNWQTVTLGGRFEDWLEAPVLYMSGHLEPKLDEGNVQRIREYCLRGGMVLGVACCSRAEFAQGFRALAARAFPDYPLRQLPPRHALFTDELQFPIEEPPPLFEVNNGQRTLMLLSPVDISAAWQQYLVEDYEKYLHLGCNIYLFATDKSSFASRLQTTEIPAKNVKVRQTVNLVRVAHDGNWDVEPFGWSRLARFLNNEAGLKLLVTSGMRWNELSPDEFKIAYMSGNKAFELSKEEAEGLRKFLTGGGTLLADAANASPDFLRSFESHVADALRGSPVNIPEDNPLITGRGIPDAVSLDPITFRRAARQIAIGQRAARLRGFKIGKRWAVIYSPLDVSSGLLGTPIYGCRGYAPESALQIARNMVLYAALPSSEKAKLERAR